MEYCGYVGQKYVGLAGIDAYNAEHEGRGQTERERRRRVLDVVT